MSKKRIITIIKDRKQTKKLKIFAYCIETFSLKQVTINPAENVRVDTGVEITLPDNLFGLLMLLPDIHTFKLKSRKTIKEFNILRTSFSKTFTFKRRKTSWILMLINTNENEVFKFVQNIVKQILISTITFTPALFYCTTNIVYYVLKALRCCLT